MGVVDSTKVTLVPMCVPQNSAQILKTFIEPLSTAHMFLPNGSLQFSMKATLSCVNHFPLLKLQDTTLTAVSSFRSHDICPPAAQSKSLRGEAAAFSLAVKLLGFSPLCIS